MLERITQQALSQGMKLLSHPKVAQLAADPRLMAAIVKGLALKSRLQSDLEQRARTLASALTLVTRADLQDSAEALRYEIQRHLRDLEARTEHLEQRVKSDAKDAAPRRGAK